MSAAAVEAHVCGPANLSGPIRAIRERAIRDSALSTGHGTLTARAAAKEGAMG